MEYRMIMLICLFLGIGGFAAFILWIRDRGGPLGRSAGGTLVALQVIVGVACLINGIRSLIVNSEIFLSREFEFAFWTIVQLWIGIQVVWAIEKWLIDWRTGTEIQGKAL